MGKLNPEIIKAIEESKKNPDRFTLSVDGKNCKQVLQMLALHHTAKKLTQNDHHSKYKNRSHSERLLSA